MLDPSVLPERPTHSAGLRADALLADRQLLQLGLEGTRVLGRSVRLSLVAAGGVALGGDETRGSARGELTARFLFDPDGRHRWGLYAGGGAGTLYNGDRWDAILSLAVGVEKGRPAVPGAHPFFEIGLGGGARIAVGVRW